LIVEVLIAALAGLLIGSFLNVCIYRLPRDLSVVMPRSFCPECEKPIAWFDNIPLLSFALLRGRCRHCGQPIPLRYPIVELLTAAAFACAIWFLGVTAVGLKFSVFGAILVTLVFSDLEERILPDEFTLGGTAAGLAFAAFVPLRWSILQLFLPLSTIHNQRMISVVDALLSAAFCSGVLWAVGALYQKIRHREGLGLGDVKMVAMIGAFLGIEGALLAIIAASLLGAVVGLFFIWFTGKDASTYELPFGTFLGVAALLVGFWSEVIFNAHGHVGS
jgi:leader peptidase (prepilin peptidase)/N-methyltransferase